MPWHFLYLVKGKIPEYTQTDRYLVYLSEQGQGGTLTMAGTEVMGQGKINGLWQKLQLFTCANGKLRKYLVSEIITQFGMDMNPNRTKYAKPRKD